MGMHYRDKKEGVKLLFKDKTGMGLLFHNMVGRFDIEEDIDIAKEDFYRGKTSVTTMLVDSDKCERLKQYGENFKDDGEQYNYGLDNNPFVTVSKLTDFEDNKSFAQKEKGIPFGAGCSGHVMSALQELSLNEAEYFQMWFSKVRVPETLIGQYSDQIYYTKEETEEFHDLNQDTDKKSFSFKSYL